MTSVPPTLVWSACSAKHHVEAAVSVRQDALALQARRRALLCVLRDAHEVDEGKQDRDGILAGLQQARDDVAGS